MLPLTIKYLTLKNNNKMKKVRMLKDGEKVLINVYNKLTVGTVIGIKVIPPDEDDLWVGDNEPFYQLMVDISTPKEKEFLSFPLTPKDADKSILIGESPLWEPENPVCMVLYTDKDAYIEDCKISLRESKIIAERTYYRKVQELHELDF